MTLVALICRQALSLNGARSYFEYGQSLRHIRVLQLKKENAPTHSNDIERLHLAPRVKVASTESASRQVNYVGARPGSYRGCC